MEMAFSGAKDESHEALQMIALLGPAKFLSRLIPVEKADTEYLRFNETNSRDFLLLRILVEVQKAGFAMERWRKLAAVEKLEEPRKTYDNALRVILESIADEQSLWQRKLSEALVLLIGFSTTNAPAYYYHFLLLHELQRQIGGSCPETLGRIAGNDDSQRRWGLFSQQAVIKKQRRDAQEGLLLRWDNDLLRTLRREEKDDHQRQPTHGHSRLLQRVADPAH